MESVVRGHHVYKEIWTPELGEVLTVCKEPDNIHDRHAVCVKVAAHALRSVLRKFTQRNVTQGLQFTHTENDA